jgi:hypothetical protein
MVDRVGTFDDALSASAQRSISARRQAESLATTAAKKARALEFARMRHELLMAGSAGVAVPNRKVDAGSDVECECDCDPCGDDNCEGCMCDGCGCDGCVCETAMATRERKFARMRHEIAVR